METERELETKRDRKTNRQTDRRRHDKEFMTGRYTNI